MSLNAQTDTIKSNSISTKLKFDETKYPVLEIPHHYYNGEKGSSLVQDNKDYFLMTFDTFGVILVKAEVELLIIQERLVTSGDFSTYPNTPRLTINSRILLRKNGIYIEYFSNGNLKLMGRKKWGENHGTYKHYDINSHLIKREKWKHGILLRTKAY